MINRPLALFVSLLILVGTGSCGKHMPRPRPLMDPVEEDPRDNFTPQGQESSNELPSREPCDKSKFSEEPGVKLCGGTL